MTTSIDSLKGQIALVTGATGGIGRAIVRDLIHANVKVIAHGRNPERLDNLQVQFPDIIAESADLKDIAEVEMLAHNSLKHFGRIDILINNAGIGVFKNALDMDIMEYGATMDVNLRAAFILCKIIGKNMIEKHSGYIINIGSGASKTPIAGLAAYCASKHGLLGFSESLALELRSSGIKVSLIMPGSVATAFGDNDPDERLKTKPGILLPEDISETVMFLLRQPKRAWTSQVNIRPLDPEQGF